jgi:3',5'-cyclic AMP phosphodiesterase CpdA
MFTLAHLSDPHLPPMPRPSVTELAGKRALGFVNWQRGRKNFHRAGILDATVRDVKAFGADHIVVTGDLVNLSLRDEFVPARAWLESLGAPADVTLVPGNHDIYVAAARPWPAAFWGDYMRGDDAANGGSFPFVRRRGPVALIALSTAVPTAPFLATGRLGPAQLAGLAELLEQTREQFRIVLIHHPPLSRTSRYLRRLTDAAALRAVLAANGAELLLHGHDHRRALVWLEGPQRRIPAIGVPSASAHVAHSGDTAGGFNTFRIEGAPGAWRCELTTWQRDAGGAQSVERHELF